MPQYKISLSDGRTVEIESDTEPTEDEVLSAIGAYADQGPIQVPESISEEFMYQPPPGDWVRTPSADPLLPDERTLGERATASLAQGGIGLQQGFQGLGEQGWSAVQAAYEPIVEIGPVALTMSGIKPTATARDTAAFARESALEARRRSQALEPLAQEIGGAPIMRTIGQAIPSVAPALASGPLGLPAAIAVSGAQAGAGTLSEAQAVFEQAPEQRRPVGLPNVEFWDAAGPAALNAIQTAAITAVAGKLFGQGIEGATLPVKREAIKQTVGSRAKEVLGEALEESAQQFLSDYVIGQMSYNPGMTFEQALKGAIDAGIAGGVVGGGLVTTRAITEPRAEPTVSPPVIPLEQPAGAIDETAINRALEQQLSPPVFSVAPLRTELPSQPVPEKGLSADEANSLIFEAAKPTVTGQGTKLSGVVPVSEIESLSAGLADAQSLLFPGELGMSVRKAQFPNRPADSRPRLPDALGNLFNRESITDQSGENLDVNRTRTVMPMVLRTIEKPEVFNSVIPLIPVDMVNMLSSEKFPTDKLLHDPSVFVDALSSHPNPLVPLRFLGYLNGLHLLDKTIQSKPSQVYAIFKKSSEILRPLLEPKISQESEIPLSPDESSAQAAQALATAEPVSAIATAPPLTPAETPVSQEPVGMGAATPAEFKPPVPFTTSNKNAVVDEERKARGLPPVMSVARQSNQEAWDNAMRQIDTNPKVQDDLIADLAVSPRALTATENAMLLHRRIDLRNEYEKALHRWRQAFASGDVLQEAEESRQVRDWSAELADLEDITKRTGAESGRSLQARKMMADEEFSLAAMEMRAMEAKGRTLTPEEHVELIKAQARILELENQLLALEANRDSVEIAKGATKTMDDVSKDAPKEPTSKDFDVDREEKLLSGIKAKVDKGQVNEITPLVQQLARLFWRRGIRQREPMIDALHKTLETIIPGFTRDQTQRAFSGYGNFKPLSKDEIDVGLRDLRGQTQQVLKMEALEARKPLEKTGQERRVPSDEERRLIKQVNELKRKYGVVVTDPATQLKSALAARKTYYEHRIADLKHEIETRQRIVRDKTAPPTDPELDALIAEHERLKAEHEQIFVRPEMSDEQRLKLAIAAAERNQAHWEVRLENAEKGVFDKRKPSRKVTSPELELIQAETAAIREHVKELHDLDAAVLEAKRTESLKRQKANLEKDIAEQERKLREGDLAGPGKRMARPADPALEELLQKRDALNQQLKEARKKPEAQKHAEAQQRELERLNKAIAEREAKIAAGDISTEPKKINRPLPPELEQARQRLEAVNKQLAEMRKAARPVKTKEEIALQALKTRMKNRAAEFHRRILAKDFAKRVRTPVKLDEEGRRLKAEVDLAKEKFETALEQDRWAKMSVFDKTKRKIADIYDAARALMTTGEFSFILRQGKLAVLSHPIQTSKALPDMFRAFTPDMKLLRDELKSAITLRDIFKAIAKSVTSEQKAREIDLKTHNDPDADAARAAKLYLVEEGFSLHKQEEILMGRWVGKIPIVQNFNRAAQVFLNRVRLDMWKAMRKSLTRSGTPTPEEDRQIAMFVNEATGRGGLGKLEPSAVWLGRAMFSPRYYASRLQLAAGHSLWGGTMRTRRIIATEYARALVGLGLYYTALAMMFSSDDDEEKGSIETDPRSSDFGKVQIGNTRLDPLAGLSQVITLGTRTGITGINALTGTEIPEKKTLSGEPVRIRGENVPFGGQKWTDIVANHLRGKLHPVPSSVANLFDGTDLGGDEATVINQTKNMLAPITYIDIYTALKEEGLNDGAALALLALLGEGLQTYEER